MPKSPVFGAVLELTQLSFLVIDKAGKVVHLNQLASEELGYEPDALQVRTIFEVNPHISFLDWKKVWTSLEKRQIITEETELMTASSVLFPVRVGMCMIGKGTQKYCLYLIKNLLESNRHKDLLELTSALGKIGSWECDLVRQQFFLSQEAAAILGLEKKEKQFTIPGFFLWLRQYIARPALKRLLGQSRAATENGTPFELEIKLKNGPTFKIQGVPQVSEGITAKLFGTIQGITEKGEERSVSHFILENAIEMIAWGAEDGRLSHVNQALCEQSGFSKRALSNMKVTDLFLNLSEEDWQQKWQKLVQDQSFEMEVVLQTKDGKPFPVYLLLKYLQYHEEGYFCAFMRSLSVKKERQELLDLMYHTLNHTNDLIFWLEEDGNLRYVNDTACEELNYARKELLEMDFQTIFPGYEEQAFREKFVDEKFVEGEAVIRDKAGRELPVETIQTHLDFRNKKIACVIFRDISARKRKEKELQEAIRQIELLNEKLQGEKSYLREEISDKFSFNNIISQSSNYRKVLRQVARVASTEATVLILGETGTGKELLARAIHNLSEREEETMVKVNCAALPKHLIESELFGHEKGAFTGAHKRKIGRFEFADGGTIFLDEIGELPLELQSKLLRILQEGTFERLGSNQTIKVDVRVIAATNRKLEQLVEEGRFRQDLYYRLNVFPIYNIPLRERTEDIPLLVQYFVKKNCEKAGRSLLKVPKKAVDRLMLYPFPGNVRELENIVERAVILSRGKELNLDAVISNLSKRRKRVQKEFLSFEDMQRKHILEALKRTNWKVTGKLSAAQLLKMNGKTLASKMRKLGIRREDYLETFTEHF